MTYECPKIRELEEKLELSRCLNRRLRETNRFLSNATPAPPTCQTCGNPCDKDPIGCLVDEQDKETGS